MKYGDNFEKESVPEWSLHNLDYNSLKHYIKVHTTKDQAKAIAIPGQTDAQLVRVEDELYCELCRQHDRVDLFITAKADEINRRLRHLSDQIRRLLLKCTTLNDNSSTVSPRRVRRLYKLERDVARCGEETQHLERFVNAQVIAFRKILKKYKKWTGSATLGSRFRDNILSNPKSFTRRDFQGLQQTCEGLLATLRASTPADSEPVSPLTEEPRPTSSRRTSTQQSLRHVVLCSGAPQTHSFLAEEPRYWNEYDNGSEGGDTTEAYTIYVNPNDDSGGQGLSSLLQLFTQPIEKACSWMNVRRPERQPLLSRSSSDTSYGVTDTTTPPSTTASYFTHPPGQSPRVGHDWSLAADTDSKPDDDREPDIGYASSEEFPAGYEAHYAALPSVNDQRIHRYREQVLSYAALGCFAVAFLLAGIAAVLLTTGRHRLRVEVDAGVTLCVMVSLGCACTALALTVARKWPLDWTVQVTVGVVFAAICVLNGMLLVLVVGNTAV